MSESKSAMFSKTVQKHAGRAKEKLLQNLGKVDRTLDDIFEEHLQNFNRQHQQATRLQKEFNNYIRCIRAVQTASKTLMEAITEVYESGWSGHDLLYVQAQNLELLWQDFSHKLGDQVLIPLNTYTNQFPEVRKKIEKRGRKLVDYDSQRHSFQNLQANANKRRDDVKVTKGREQLEEAKRTYEVMNSELHDELPALYDSRVLFYVNNLQTLFTAEQLFHAESNKVYNELEAITDKLAHESQRGSYKKPPPAALPALPALNGNGTASANGTASDDTVQTPPSSPALNGDAPPSPEPSPPPHTPSPPKSPSTPLPETTPTANNTTPTTQDNSLATETNSPAAQTKSPSAQADSPAVQTNSPSAQADSPASPTTPPPETAPTAPARVTEDKASAQEPTNNNDKDARKDDYDIPVGSPATETQNNNVEGKRQVDVEKKELERDSKPGDNDAAKDEVYDIPVGATLSGLPAGTLYRVRATYRYTREDSDELSFDVGDVIRVVEYEDPEEQEEGWLMGIKETTNEKGMFPANFTRPI